MDEKTRDELQDIIQTAFDHGFAARHIATALVNAGYRLDPYPNGKSKDELIARIETVEAERDKTRNLLRDEHYKEITAHGPHGTLIGGRSHLPSDLWDRHTNPMGPRCPVCTFLAETSSVKP